MDYLNSLHGQCFLGMKPITRSLDDIFNLSLQFCQLILSNEAEQAALACVMGVRTTDAVKPLYHMPNLHQNSLHCPAVILSAVSRWT